MRKRKISSVEFVERRKGKERGVLVLPWQRSAALTTKSLILREILPEGVK